MARKPGGWRGSRVEDFLADQMRNPAFRMAFSEARGRRIKWALADAVRKVREARGLSQAAVVKRAKTTQAVVSRIENPAVPYLPSIEVLARLSVALGARLEIALLPSSKTSSEVVGGGAPRCAPANYHHVTGFDHAAISVRTSQEGPRGRRLWGGRGRPRERP